MSAARRAALERGAAESRDLVEWLAFDHGKLLACVLGELGEPLPGRAELAAFSKLPVMQRTQTAAQLLDQRDPRHERRLRGHPSDTVRSWGALMVGCGAAGDLERRLRCLLPYAGDPHMGVRECAWLAFRPHLAADLERGLSLLAPLARHADFRVRRFASEASRPRGVWCAHLRALRERPELGLSILEPLRADPERYVQLSVGNWLNDASKDQPQWVESLCRRWTRASRSTATAHIVRRALRTIARAG